MSSQNNAIFTNATYTGEWETVDDHASVHFMLKGASGNLVLEWSNQTSNNIIATETINIADGGVHEISRNIICSRLRPSFTKTDQNNQAQVYIHTMYRNYLKQMTIADESGNTMSVTNGAMHVLITDENGNPVGTTSAPNNNALYSSVKEELQTVGGALSVVLSDCSGYPLDTTGNTGAYYVRLTDACGFPVGATNNVIGSSTTGIASYMSLPVSSFITDFSNCMFAATRDASGMAIGTIDNLMPTNAVGRDISYSFAFDISNGVTNIAPITIVNRPVLIYTLNCYNAGEVTAWVNLYDQSSTTFHPKIAPTTQKIAVPAASYRDINYSIASNYESGLSAIGVMSVIDHDKTLAANTLFLSGIYSTYTPPQDLYIPYVPPPTITTDYGDETEYTGTIWDIDLSVEAMQLVYEIIENNTTIEIPARYSTGKMYIDWGDNHLSTVASKTLHSHTYSTVGTYTVSIVGSFTHYGYNVPVKGISRLIRVKGFGKVPIQSLDNAFLNAVNLVSVPTTLPVTVKILNYTFAGATGFVGTDIENWNVTEIISAIGMFSGCTLFNGNISNWQLTSMREAGMMFNNASAFNRPIGSWVLPKLFTAQKMFYGATSFNQVLDGWRRPAYYDNDIFTGSGMTSQNYSATLVAWRDYVYSVYNTTRQVIRGIIGAEGISAGRILSPGFMAREDLIRTADDDDISDARNYPFMWRIKDGTQDIYGITGPVGITAPVSVTGYVNLTNIPTVIGLTGMVESNNPVSITGPVKLQNIPSKYLTEISLTGPIGASGPVSVLNLPVYYGATGIMTISGEVNVSNAPSVIIGNNVTNFVNVGQLNINSNVTGSRGLYFNSAANMSVKIGIGNTVVSPLPGSLRDGSLELNTFANNTVLDSAVVVLTGGQTAGYINATDRLDIFDANKISELQNIQVDTGSIYQTAMFIDGKITNTPITTTKANAVQTYEIYNERKYLSLNGTSEYTGPNIMCGGVSSIIDVTQKTFGPAIRRIYYVYISVLTSPIYFIYNYVDQYGDLRWGSMQITAGNTWIELIDINLPVNTNIYIVNINEWITSRPLGLFNGNKVELKYGFTKDVTGSLGGGTDYDYYNSVYTVPNGKVATICNLSFYSAQTTSLIVQVWSSTGESKAQIPIYGDGGNLTFGLLADFQFTSGDTVVIYNQYPVTGIRICNALICETDV